MIVERTLWAEKFVDTFSSRPLTAECVFHSPQYIDKDKQKEVCDLLLILRRNAILVSMKCQDDPTSRTGDKLRRWAIKNSTSAAKQAKGALNTLAREHFWCLHSRRGRVDFEPSSIHVSHIVILTEVLGDPVDLPNDLPLALGEIPVTYLSVNDFLNLINELRAFPDITGYLDARRTLSDKYLRMIGHEVHFYKYYILNQGSLDGCESYADARISNAARDAEWQVVFAAGQSRHQFGALIEYVSDALATRLKNFSEGLDVETTARFDGADDRKRYILMQEELCDLRLVERTALGEYFTKAIHETEIGPTEGMTYAAFFTDSKPDLVYLLVSARGVDRPILLPRLTTLLRAAMAHYGKGRGLVVADRDGEGFEIQLISGAFTDPADVNLGEAYFAKLRMSHVPMA